MYCIKCGVELADSERVCPLCGTRVFHPDLPCGQGEPPYPPADHPRHEEVSRIGVLFVISVCMLLPAVITVLCDWRINGTIVWSGFAVGGLLLLYILAVLPLWFKRPNPVIFVPIDFAAIGVFLLYVNYATGGHWFLTFALPVTGAAGLLVCAMVTLLRYLPGAALYICGGALILSGGMAVLVEFLLNLTFGLHETFLWSFYPLAAGVVLGAMLLVIAMCKPLRRSLHRKFFIWRYPMQMIFIDSDNTLLDFDAYIRQTMREGFAHFGLKPYEPYMEAVFHRENGKLWRQIEQGTLTFRELEEIRWNNVFRALNIDFDGQVFEKYFRAALYDSAIPVDGAMELLEALHGKYPLAVASNGPYDQQLHRLELAGMKRYFDWFFVSERLGVSKPARAFFDGAFAALNDGCEAAIAPKDCVIIGDSLTSDMAGGRQYGMKTCYYRRPGAAEGTDVTWQVTDLRQIPALLEGTAL